MATDVDRQQPINQAEVVLTIDSDEEYDDGDSEDIHTHVASHESNTSNEEAANDIT